jgi:glycosyltransferase involved in cell wall biosynthesis
MYALHAFRKELSVSFLDVIPAKTVFYYTGLSLLLGLGASSIHPYFTSSRVWLFSAGALFSVCYLCLALPAKNRAQRRRHGEQGILILSQSLHVGGLERMILHLSKQLQAEGRWNVRVCAYDHSDDKQTFLEAFRESHVPVETFKKAPGFSLKAVARVIRIVYRNDIDVIHSHDLGTLMYAVIVKICSFGKVSLVHTQHSFPHSEDTFRYRLYRYIATLWIDRLSVVSKSLRTSYSQFLLLPTPIHVIENGVEFANEPILDRIKRIELRHKLMDELPHGEPENLSRFMNDLWIIYQARFYPGKGQDHALSLWQEMSPFERNRSVLCLIGPESGQGEYERIRTIIRECPEQERIFMIAGSTTPLQWLQAGDLFLSCSQYEGMPLAPLEAAGSGMPVLLSNIPGHSFLKENSRQFSLDNVSEGAGHLQAIFDRVFHGGASYQADLWERSRCIRERFSVGKMAAKYSNLYATDSA